MASTLASVVTTVVILTGVVGWVALRSIQQLGQSLRSPTVYAPPPYQNAAPAPARRRQVQAKAQAQAKAEAQAKISNARARAQAQAQALAQAHAQKGKAAQADVNSIALAKAMAQARRTPAGLGAFLGTFLALGSRDRRTEWVDSSELGEYAGALERLQTSHSAFFFRPFSALSFHTDKAHTTNVEMQDLDPNVDLALHISSHDEKHFWTVFVDTKNREVVALDSLVTRSDEHVKARVDKFLPRVKPFQRLHLLLRNYTGVVCLQTGATCGPWSIWLMTALVTGFGRCRGKDGRVIVAPLDAFHTKDVVQFYRNARS